jgi:hypothetical protein
MRPLVVLGLHALSAPRTCEIPDGRNTELARPDVASRLMGRNPDRDRFQPRLSHVEQRPDYNEEVICTASNESRGT